MAVNKPNNSFEKNNNKGFSSTVENHLSSTKNSIDFTLDNLNSAYSVLKELETKTKGYSFRQDTLEYVFKKYPTMTFEDFEGFFLSGIYNKNILSNYPEIIDFLDFENLEYGSDLIEIVIDKIIMSKGDFDEKIIGKFDKFTVPNMNSLDVAQGYFKSKLEKFLPDTQVIFGDMREIQDYIGYNQLSCDSVGFIDILGNGLLNSCLFKLYKTNPDLEKVEELNDLFSSLEKDIFLGGSTYMIPFEVPGELEALKFPKMPLSNEPLSFGKKGVVLHSMGYLNSAYYTEKVKGTFVLGSHNISEPMHAGNLTVINNETENRHNHNWLISYFGEKSGLLMYYIKSTQKEELDNFLSVDREEVMKRNEKFEEYYNEKIVPLIYGIFYRYLEKNFPKKMHE